MARFAILLVGRRIYLPTEDNQDSIIGFASLRVLSAAGEQAAVLQAKRDVFSEWNEFYNREHRAGVPELSVEFVKRIRNPLFLRSVDSSYRFFSNEEQAQSCQQNCIGFSRSPWCF